ncbi:hypothetical protein [Thermococcus sp.]
MPMSSFKAFLLIRTLFSKPILYHVPLKKLIVLAFLDGLPLPFLRFGLFNKLKVSLNEFFQELLYLLSIR